MPESYWFEASASRTLSVRGAIGSSFFLTLSRGAALDAAAFTAEACARAFKPALLSELTEEGVLSVNDRLVDFAAFADEALTVFPPRALSLLSFSDIIV